MKHRALTEHEALMNSVMEQYEKCKAGNPGTIVLFKVGDFYELFGEDAEAISKEFGLTLTRRPSLSMCGFPYHSLEVYRRKLLDAGHRVTVCEFVPCKTTFSLRSPRNERRV